MKQSWLVFLLFTVLFPHSVASALEYLQFPIQNKVRNAPAVRTGGLYNVIGEQGKRKRSRWHIAQWGIVSELSNVADCLGSCDDGTWQVQNANGSGRVLFTRNPATGNVVELMQNMMGDKFSSCEPTKEFDLFLETNAHYDYPGYREGLIRRSQRPSLGAMTNLHVQVRQQVVSAIQGTRCVEPYNVATTLIALVFENEIVGLRLYYQVISYDSRGMYFNGTWFPTAPYYGVNDDITVYGQPALVPGSFSVLYDLEVADRVKFLIRNSPELPGDPTSPHRNPYNWQLVDAYFGSIVNGEGAITSRHSEIRIFSQ